MIHRRRQMRHGPRSGVFPLVLSLTVAGGGCVDQPTTPAHPAPAVLSPETREQLAPVFDVQAAARYFHTMPQADAERVLEDMGVVVSTPPAETRRIVVPVTSTDSTVQAVLDQMWAPSRNGGSDTNGLKYPGITASADSKRKRP